MKSDKIKKLKQKKKKKVNSTLTKMLCFIHFSRREPKAALSDLSLS